MELAAFFADPASSVTQESLSRDGLVSIPKLEIEASAGGGRLVTIDEFSGGSLVAFREDWLRARGINPRFCQMMTAIGDSMEETIRDGDTLLVDRSITQVRDSGIYIVVLAGAVMVKRTQLRRDGSVSLISDNKNYVPEIVPAHELHDLSIGGRVRWFGRNI